MIIYEKIDFCLMAISARLCIFDAYDFDSSYKVINKFDSNIKSMKELYSFNKDNNEGLIIVNLVDGILILFDYQEKKVINTITPSASTYGYYYVSAF